MAFGEHAMDRRALRSPVRLALALYELRIGFIEYSRGHKVFCFMRVEYSVGTCSLQEQCQKKHWEFSENENKTGGDLGHKRRVEFASYSIFHSVLR